MAHGGRVKELKVRGGYSTASGVLFYNTRYWAASKAKADGTIDVESGRLEINTPLLLKPLEPLRVAAAARREAQRYWGERPPHSLLARAIALVMILLPPLVLGWIAGLPFQSVGARSMAQAFVGSAAVVTLFAVVGSSLRRDVQGAHHGAEHMAFHALRRSGDVTEATVAAESRFSTACGTNALLFVLVVGALLHVALNRLDLQGLPAVLGSRLALVPASIVVGLAAHLAASRLPYWASAPFLWPGLLAQRLFTAEPTPAQISVAVASLQRLLKQARAELPSGSCRAEGSEGVGQGHATAGFST